MTISTVIMQVTVSVVAMYVAVSSRNFIVLFLTIFHKITFHHCSKYSSKIKILCG